jgi:hypothetical protein
MNRLFDGLFICVLLLVFIDTTILCSSFISYPGLDNLSSTTLHLSTLGSLNKRGVAGADPIYADEQHDYPWLHQLIQVLVIKVTSLPPGTVYIMWPLFQLFLIVTGAYGIGKALIGGNGGQWVVLFSIIIRSTKRVMFLSWPLYTSFGLVYLLILFVSWYSIRRKMSYLVIGGCLLGLIFMTHINTFVACALLPLLALLFGNPDGRTIRRRLIEIGILYFIAFLVSSAYWYPLFENYRFKIQSATQEFVYFDMKLYPWPQYSTPAQIADMVLNRVTSEVEGRENSCSANNALVFLFAISGLILVGRNRSIGNRLILIVFITFLLARLHHIILYPLISFRLQFFRFSDYLEISYAILAGLSMTSIDRLSRIHWRPIFPTLFLILLACFHFSSTHYAIQMNEAIQSGRGNDWGIISKDNGRMMAIDNGSRFACFFKASQTLYNTDGVINTDPYYSQLLNIMNQGEYLAGPKGYSNIFVDVGLRERLSRYIYYGVQSAGFQSLFSHYNITHVVVDPYNFNKWPLGMTKFRSPLFEKTIECWQDDLPSPTGDTISGPVIVYKVNQTYMQGAPRPLDTFLSCYYAIPLSTEVSYALYDVEDVREKARKHGLILVHGEGRSFDSSQAQRIAQHFANSFVTDDYRYEGKKGDEITIFIGGPATNDYIAALSFEELTVLYHSPFDHSCIFLHGNDLIVGGYKERSTRDAVNLFLSLE